MDLGLFGVWSPTLRAGESSAVLESAAELEELGYGTIWFPGREHEGLAEHISSILQRTRRVVVATGIVNIWTHPAAGIAAEHIAITQAHPALLLLGLAVKRSVSARAELHQQPAAPWLRHRRFRQRWQRSIG